MPVFSGEASDPLAAVTVRVYAGASVEGVPLVNLEAPPPAFGTWTVGILDAAALSTGVYTAVAEQPEPLGGTSEATAPVTFDADAAPPEVTIEQPPSPSDDTSPSFSGTADEPGQVVIHVLSHEVQVASATATASGGTWSSDALSRMLPQGRHAFTVFATEASAIGNAEGKSATLNFEVDTEVPALTINAPPTPSNDTTPSFSGTTSEDGEIVVHVFDGSTEVATPATRASGGRWSTGPIGRELPDGEHNFTAYATEVSGLGNGEGESHAVGFFVSTESPRVTLNSPATPSRETTPTFDGTASEGTEVVVHILQGGVQIATASSIPSGGSWSSAINGTLPSGLHTFTAYATEKSTLGNEDGISDRVSFVVDTEPPSVTLQPPALVSNNRTPAFSGTAGDTEPVTLRIYSGREASGTPVREFVETVSGGKWTTAHVTALSDGAYTALATEKSSLGNADGASSPAVFEVDTDAPDVAIEPPPARTRLTNLAFSGTVQQPHSEMAPVTVYIYEGPSAGGPIRRQLTAAVVGGRWQTGPISPVLPGGRHVYTAVATAESTLGNTPGESAPATFEVDTEAPVVQLSQPPTPSGDTTPQFSGSASESGSVTVSVYRGEATSGPPVAEIVTAATQGEWVAAWHGAPLEAGVYTAQAQQQSSLGNAPGISAPRSFRVDTSSPLVTLDALASPSPNRSPSFSGTAAAYEPVTVEIFAGACSVAGGSEARCPSTPLTSVTAEGTGGEWVSPRLEQALEFGEYTAVARQPSPIGNQSGSSEAIEFAIQQIAPVAGTEAPASVTSTSVALYATVSPNSGPISACTFEFGTSTAYGSRVECGFVTGLLSFPAADSSPVPVFARIYGLHPSTTYHARIVAVGEGGTGVGADVSFTTLPAPTFPSPHTEEGAKPKGSRGVAGLFAAQLPAKGANARIRALLAHRFFKQRFKVPEAGRLSITWKYVPAGRAARKGAAKHTVLVAAGALTIAAAGTPTITIRLTAAGRQLLKNAAQLRVTSTCSFRPRGGPTVGTTSTFSLRR